MEPRHHAQRSRHDGAILVATATPPPSAPAPEGGEQFRLLHELGRGGMGVVYLAEDQETGERCAVKVLHPQLTEDETSVARFQTEARAASAINHHAIIRLRGDIGRLSDGRWYFVMEYVDGHTLTQLVAQRGPLPLAVILEILAPICEALDMAHAANIIHRDLKPDNVIVTLRADGYVPKLLDFGIAKLLHEPGVTRPGATPGTTAHMAPEQLRGDAADRRCDVYALGVLAYQMITGGHLPYDALDGTLYHAQMTAPPIDPRQRCPAVPAVAVGPILAAIHTDPAQRLTTAGAFALMIARLLVGPTPQTDGMAILQRVAPRLLLITNHGETLRAPGVTGVRGSSSWSYSYVALLGKGGFGEVHRGVKHGAASAFALPVAIKRILSEYAENPVFVEMFHQEARIAALLGEHPNVVKVIDHAVDPFGQLAIVMEFIDGVDLDKLRQSGPLPYSVIIYIIGEILEGLGYAHHLPLPGALSSADEIAARGQVRGVIHRDMSHHNVMVSWHGAVKVMDFGIAKLRQATVAPGSDMIKGKPGYLSPEQATTAVALDGRADLFAVGIMLWELLAGRSLFERDDDYRATIAAVLFAVIKPPSQYRADVPPELDAIAMRLLQRDPSDRYQTAQQAGAALMACHAASRSAKAELQHLMRARFPERVAHTAPTPPIAEPPGAATAPDSPHALVAPWQAESTTHSHAVGQSTADLVGRSRRRSRLAIAALGVGIGAAATVAILATRHGDRSTPGVQSPAATDPPFPKSSANSTRTPTVNAPSAPALPATSSLAISTEPTDAMVRVEDATKMIASGRSPLTVPVPQGAHIQIRADASGYEPALKAITIGELDQQAVVLALVPSAHLQPLHPTSAPKSSAVPVVQPAPKSQPPSASRPIKPAESDDKILE
jgi:serine/threonine protein kinase